MFTMIKNHAGQQAFPLEKPWTVAKDYYAKVPEGAKQGKTTMSRWSLSPSTDHAFLSLYEGVNQGVRLSYPDNPIHQMHGLIVDYDRSISMELLAQCQNSPPKGVPHFPAWMVETASGQGRLIWLFEKPVRFSTKEQAKEFLRRMEKALKLNSWLGGFDRKAFMEIITYFDIGKEWFPVFPDAVIPSNYLNTWFLDASKNLRLDSQSVVNIPIEEVAKEVEAKFPGRWTGPFELGRRGLRFWDPMADNQTAAIVHEQGMICFTGDSSFMPWRRIFGDSFVNKFRAELIGGVLDCVALDQTTNDFWLKDHDMDDWAKTSRGHLLLWLRQKGFSPDKEKGQMLSPLEEIELAIKKHRSVEAAAPHLYRPKELIVYNNEPILNTSRCTVMKPAPPGCFNSLTEARQYFPWLWKLLSNFFESDGSNYVQLEYFLSWLKHFYESGYYLKPTPGHALGIGGPTGRGKTFLISVVVSRIMGGASDATDFLVRGAQWTDSIAKWPVAVIDDSEAAGDYQKHQRFSSLLKKMVANQSLPYNGKYKANTMVEWNGRAVICFNLDSESIKLLPSLENSIYDKIALLRVAESRFVYPASREESSAILDRELPYFCRFLLDWATPQHLINEKDTRYFLKPFKHMSLVEAAVHQGMSQLILEVIVDFLAAVREQDGKRKFFEGTTASLHKALSMIHGSTMNKLSPAMVGTALGQLKARGFPVEQTRTRAGRMWRIPVDLDTLDSIKSIALSQDGDPVKEEGTSTLTPDDLFIAE